MSNESTTAITGIVFRRTYRAAYACLDILCSGDSSHDEDRHISALVEYDGISNVCHFRSYLKRMCKIGNEIQLEGCWDDDHRFNVYLDVSSDEFYLGLKIVKQQKLNTIQCQTLREKFCPAPNCFQKTDVIANGDIMTHSRGKYPTRQKEKMECINDDVGNFHSGGLCKRQQGEILRDFLIQVIVHTLLVSNSITHEIVQDAKSNNITAYESFSIDNLDHGTLKHAINFLNSGSGIIDVAGGSGHVSLAFSLFGIKSTVIDPRETVGKLPGRDRKILKKAMKNKKNAMDKGEMEHESFLPPPIEYASLRAWFSKRPEGIDSNFREGASSHQSLDYPEMDALSMSVPVCTVCSPDNDLLQNCSAIVALHPDEATGDIVDFAVEHRIPFAIVPCCVFSRLFPRRFIVDDNDEGKVRLVSTYQDLIQFLARKHESIRISKLGFSGANIVLWSTFPKE